MFSDDHILERVLTSSLELSRLFLSEECTNIEDALTLMDISDEEADVLLELIEAYLADKSL